ncbi:MAG: pyridoxal 5'-phosphate synthase glutaminase subunit PdxT [Alicyclobacillus sp.]|nr:pyridoxal 5'-phosphate synthase glutaminase subunit PdxT [Alicyclobacillus sp.]
MRIGVLGLQGAFVEHERMLSDLGADTVTVKRPQHLTGLDGLVIPGGESTTIGKLMREYDLIQPIRDLVQAGMPLLGTCAGMIVMAKRIEGEPEPHLGVLDVTVCRNSFGRQRESFETPLEIPVLGHRPFPAVFIRAPHVTQTGNEVQVLARYEGRVVAVQQARCVALSFHPELTGDLRIHEYFLNLCRTPAASS